MVKFIKFPVFKSTVINHRQSRFHYNNGEIIQNAVKILFTGYTDWLKAVKADKNLRIHISKM